MQAAIAGAIAEPFYGGIPDHILDGIRGRLNRGFKQTVVAFCAKFGTPEMAAQARSLAP